MKRLYDLLVIGAGSGGLASARRAAKYGKKVGIIEGGKLGGTCVNLGCVPKKVMWNAACMLEDLKISESFGIKIQQSTSFPVLKANRDQYISKLNGIYLNNLVKDHIDVISGWGKFVDPNTVQVGNQEYSAENIVIATGSTPLLPSFPGKELVFTSEDFFKLEKLPEKVLVIGNGYIAAEIAGIFRAFSVDTTISIRNPSFLRTFDCDIGAFLTKIYSAHGVRFQYCSEIQNISRSNNLLKVITNNSTEEYSAVFSAIGRIANISGLNLEKIGVKLESGHIVADKYDQTSVKGVYAIGDVVSKVSLTPVAIAAGRKLSDRLFAGKTKIMDYENIPSVVFSHPPIGSIGMTESQAKTKFSDVKVYKSEFNSMFYALSQEKTLTFMKLIVAGSDEKIVGLHGCGKGIDEMIQGFAVGIKMGATKEDFDNTIAIHPTASEEFLTLS